MNQSEAALYKSVLFSTIYDMSYEIKLSGSRIDSEAFWVSFWKLPRLHRNNITGRHTIADKWIATSRGLNT